MPEKLSDAKAAMRQEIRLALTAVTRERRANASKQARDLLTKQRVWQQAHSILFFAPTEEEVDIWPLMEAALREGKLVALPRFVTDTATYSAGRVQNLANDIQPGIFKIREPIERCPEMALNRLDLILVPGVAFDLRGRRLGRGKGFYDQILAAACGTTCGVAFEEQLVREVPVEPHDIHLNCILTPTRWLELKSARGLG